MTALFAAIEFVRGRTWLFEIVLTLLGDEAGWTDTGTGWRRFDRHGGLSINVNKAVWFRHSDRKGGISPLKLIALLRPGTDPRQWLAAWLLAHPGTGSCTVVDGDEDDELDPASALIAARMLTELVAVEGTVGERYLRSRALVPPYPACIKFLEHARTGESALVGLLTAHDRTVALQLTYLTPAAKKSLRPPLRARFNLERAPGAVFWMPPRPEAL